MPITTTKKIFLTAGLLAATACSFASHDLTIHYLNGVGKQFGSMTVPVIQNQQPVNKIIAIGDQTQFTINNIDSIPHYPLHTPVILSHGLDDMNCGLYKMMPINPQADSMTIRVEENGTGTPHCYVSTDD
jgi:hypothetical protein